MGGTVHSGGCMLMCFLGVYNESLLSHRVLQHLAIHDLSSVSCVQRHTYGYVGGK